MEKKLTLMALRELLERRDLHALRAALALENEVDIAELLLARDEQRVEEIMEREVITAETTEDQEAAVERMMRYDFISLPVVDREGRLVGVVLSGVNYLRLLLTYPDSGAVALTVALALFVTVLLAKTVGGVLPMAAKLLGADPAIMAAPLITTIVDAISLVVYFTIASALLPI